MALFGFTPADSADQRDYWLERAEVHFDLGERTADTRASWAHYQFAGRYLDRVYGGAPAGISTQHQLVAELVAG